MKWYKSGNVVNREIY